MYRFLILLATLLVTNLWAQPFTGLSEAVERGSFGSMKALLISRKGEIIFEQYFRGAQPGDLQVLNSVTKSVGAALIGIAHRQGKIRLDDNLDLFFDDLYPMSLGMYQDKQTITVENVLRQQHGIVWNEFDHDFLNSGNPTLQMITSDDWYRFVLVQPVESDPGLKFTYSTGASTLMSRMIRFVSGQSPDQFARQELFGPLGIEEVKWEGSISVGPGGGSGDWPNPDNDQSLGYSLWLKPTDMLKFGELYLNGGVYQGRRILDQSWVDASHVAYSNSGNDSYFSDQPGSGYGYQWWTGLLSDQLGRDWPMYFAAGWGKQFIMVFPELDMVVVSVANDYDYRGPGLDSLLSTMVLPEMVPLLDQSFNGTWYDPETTGQGLTLEVLEDGQRLLGFWYTFDMEGDQRWFMLDGRVSGAEAEASIFQAVGGVFLQADPVSLDEWGNATLKVVDCDHMTLEIDSAEVVTSIPLTRLTGDCAK